MQLFYYLPSLRHMVIRRKKYQKNRFMH